eukprot:Nitzschia sp. Nitz4//scaffold35_size145790//85172//87847//NITZ4_003034-RA/size145790-snap-gene-0.15-mRNA-1//1//CDS//3329549136//343//frame0
MVSFPMRLILLLTLLLLGSAAETTEDTGDHSNFTYTDDEGLVDELELGGEEEEEAEPAFAILYPPFALTVGVFVFFILSRHVQALPYTAVMFLIGVMMGIAAEVSEFQNHMAHTLNAWIGINSEVLLLVFLPGLIFKDAFGQNVHLFLFALVQLLIFAFPLVLAGTVVGALVGYYIFPFGWSFNFAMTVGSILAATDPVAVAALLEEVGAPPRLKVHVAGEALLNDGSAIVFFSIFSERFFNEFGIEGFGEEIDLAKGVGMFCQKAIGGTLIGLMFGGGLLAILYSLSRRFSHEENIVQVTTIVGIAYLNYYVADYVWKTSGVIASVSAGILVKIFGGAMINDMKLLEDFLTVVEHILNTVLFMLGGVVWGSTIALGEKEGHWRARDWGYLILLFILMNLLRGLQFLAVYPITSRIGLKTNWQESLFQVYGGLRGAVGIALAIALDSEVAHVSGGTDTTEEEIHTQQAFAMIGGMAFLTLVINGTTAGPLLRALGLADSTEARQRIVDAYKIRFRANTIDTMVRLLCQRRFRNVNFALVKHHVPHIADLTKAQLLQAVAKHKSTIPAEEYVPPNLVHILPYLPDDTDNVLHEGIHEVEMQLREDLDKVERNHRIALRSKNRRTKRLKGFSTSNLRYMMDKEPLSAQELRILFLSILKATYDKQVEDGELDGSHLLYIALNQSLEFAHDAVMKGETLKDWEFLLLIHDPISKFASTLKKSRLSSTVLNATMSKHHARLGLKDSQVDLVIERSISFMAAHRAALKSFNAELQDADSELSEAAKVVVDESEQQYHLADKALDAFAPRVTSLAISHKFCKILLSAGVHHVEKLVDIGLLKESEAEHFVEEIEEELHHVAKCNVSRHPGEMEEDDEDSEDIIEEEPTKEGDV